MVFGFLLVYYVTANKDTSKVDTFCFLRLMKALADLRERFGHSFETNFEGRSGIDASVIASGPMLWKRPVTDTAHLPIHVEYLGQIFRHARAIGHEDSNFLRAYSIFWCSEHRAVNLQRIGQN